MQSVTRLVASAATEFNSGVKCFLELGLGGSSGQAQSGSSRGPPIARCPAGYGPQRQLLQQSVLQIMRHKATGFLAAAGVSGTAGDGEEVTDTWGCQQRTGFVSLNYCRVLGLVSQNCPVQSLVSVNYCRVQGFVSPNYCRVQGFVPPNYCRVQDFVSPNYCRIQSLVSPNYCRVQGLVSPNYCRVQDFVSPNYCRIQSLVSPNYCRVQGLVSPNYCRVQGFVSPNGRVQDFVSPNYCRVQDFVSPNYCRVQDFVSPSYCRVQGFVSPNGRVQVTADGQRKVLYIPSVRATNSGCSTVMYVLH